MEFGPDDLVMLTTRWLLGLFLSVVATIAILGLVVLARRRYPQFAYWRIIAVCLALAPLAWWIIHSASRARLDYTLTLLNSESSQVAEHTYYGQFMREVGTLDKAVHLAVDKREAPNVRFYASCLVADFLATNKDDSLVANTLSEVDAAPIIETQFFGGNGLTDKFYIPGHPQPRLTVRGIVKQRIQDIRQTTQR